MGASKTHILTKEESKRISEIFGKTNKLKENPESGKLVTEDDFLNDPDLMKKWASLLGVDLESLYKGEPIQHQLCNETKIDE